MVFRGEEKKSKSTKRKVDSPSNSTSFMSEERKRPKTRKINHFSTGAEERKKTCRFSDELSQNVIPYRRKLIGQTLE